MPPQRKSIGIGKAPDAEVHPLANRARVSVEIPDLPDTWLVQIAGTTADPTIFPPDRTLPQLCFDFRDLKFEDAEPADPYGHFRDVMRDGLEKALLGRDARHLVFVGHSFGGMAAIDFLLHNDLEALQALVPTLEQVSLVMACAAHTSPMSRYQIRSDAPLIGPLATRLSHYVTKVSTANKRRMARVKGAMGHGAARPLWRELWRSTDELSAVWRFPQGASLDHFWSVVRCAHAYDVPKALDAGSSLWFDLLILSAERDAQWPQDMFDDFWRMVVAHGCSRARWCHFPGDDHLSVARQPTKYYKEIKDFLLAR